MSTFLALAVLTVVCIAAVWFFRPRYGSLRGCTGRALQATLEHETCSRGPQAPAEPRADPELPRQDQG